MRDSRWDLFLKLEASGILPLLALQVAAEKGSFSYLSFSTKTAARCPPSLSSKKKLYRDSLPPPFQSLTLIIKLSSVLI